MTAIYLLTGCVQQQPSDTATRLAESAGRDAAAEPQPSSEASAQAASPTTTTKAPAAPAADATPSTATPSTATPPAATASIATPSTLQTPDATAETESQQPAATVATQHDLEPSPGSTHLSEAPEHDADYDRDDWGDHNSSLCRGAAGQPDPYTGTSIDTCNVDHVVALDEAHESGGWAWPPDDKRDFSQDPSNHVASRACVNQSKGGDDIDEWSDAAIASSTACGGGYAVTAAGRCFLARTTVSVKSKWELAVDQQEAETLTRVLASCGEEPLTIAASATTAPVTTAPTAASEGGCVIGARTAAEYDAVHGIGETLSARLAEAQPFADTAQLQSVKGVGAVKASAVWEHFCG